MRGEERSSPQVMLGVSVIYLSAGAEVLLDLPQVAVGRSGLELLVLEEVHYVMMALLVGNVIRGIAIHVLVEYVSTTRN